MKGNFNEVSNVFQGSFKGDPRNFLGFIYRCFKKVSRKMEGCFNGVLSGFQGCLKEVLWVFEESFKFVLMAFQGRWGMVFIDTFKGA